MIGLRRGKALTHSEVAFGTGATHLRRANNYNSVMATVSSGADHAGKLHALSAYLKAMLMRARAETRPDRAVDTAADAEGAVQFLHVAMHSGGDFSLASAGEQIAQCPLQARRETLRHESRAFRNVS